MLEQLRPQWEKGALWWDERSAREQLMLGSLFAIALVALLLGAVIRPLESARARAAADIRTYQMIDLRLRQGGVSSGQRSGPPAQQISQSAAAAGLQVQRIEPQGARTNVVLADAPFDAVLRFVADLEKNSALRVSEARIERSQIAAGMVTAQFLVAGGAAG
ncbi:general secretion pathway protein M [Sphingomonas vulcanisoli]|uniref:General secretion pathway protein M n=1 Tax=Sphingomonas vulcanisoli TaxID=1658060 RepID=A0ABX0TQD7_9SPHN|nr:type II secretion system protein GspM [Sphingomonas vulcanisoli]NIJ07741.1 general secretion pathway protein M [Sphingomonas vulcanisoli]